VCYTTTSLCYAAYSISLHFTKQFNVIITAICIAELRQTRCTISRRHTWFKFTLASSNQKQVFMPLSRLRHLLHKHAFSSELTYEPSNYERVVLTFPKANATTQAFRDSVKRPGKWVNTLT